MVLQGSYITIRFVVHVISTTFYHVWLGACCGCSEHCNLYSNYYWVSYASMLMRRLAVRDWLQQIGRAGFATFILMVLTIAPMAIKYIKKKFSYEIRKLVHYLALAMMVSDSFSWHCKCSQAQKSRVHCTTAYVNLLQLTSYMCTCCHVILQHIHIQIALACHSPVLSYFCSALLVWWALDVLYMYVFQTYLIENPTYEPIGLGTSVRFEVPPHFK